MNCGKCGILNLERAKYCRSCGADMFYERDRVALPKSFFFVMSCIMLIMITVSLIYYVIEINSNEKLNKEISYIYSNM